MLIVVGYGFGCRSVPLEFLDLPLLPYLRSNDNVHNLSLSFCCMNFKCSIFLELCICLMDTTISYDVILLLSLALFFFGFTPIKLIVAKCGKSFLLLIKNNFLKQQLLIKRKEVV